MSEKDSKEALVGTEAKEVSRTDRPKSYNDPSEADKYRRSADYESRGDVADLIWDEDSPQSPVLDESAEFQSEPKFLKSIYSPEEDSSTRNVTETGSFDLRWITMASFGKLLDAIPTPVTLVHADGAIQLVNSAFERLAEDAAALKRPTFCEFLSRKTEGNGVTADQYAISQKTPRMARSSHCRSKGSMGQNAS